ncbi:MAG: M64 family metallopeptidase [Nanoarchaeota archaeon]|nr:M64 family metallopeptidase [Nanoarchaeota archaeon]
MKKIILITVLVIILTGLAYAQNCVDSDGGINLFERGFTTDVKIGSSSITFNMNDTCAKDDSSYSTSLPTGYTLENAIIEGYCEDTGFGVPQIFECKFGCVDGACLETACGNGICDEDECISCVEDCNPANCVVSPEPGQECFDSDNGINYFVRGKIEDHLSSPIDTDMCIANTLRELYCEEGNGIPVLYTCANGCSEGVCAAECVDSDNGLDYTVQGTTSSAEGVAKDICSDVVAKGKGLVEYYCEDGDIKSETYTCPELCINGKCVEECTDSDEGKDFYEKGSAEGVALFISSPSYDGEVIKRTDECEEGTLTEYFCKDGIMNYAHVECECGDGVCLSEVCSDSDGGINYYERGIVTNFEPMIEKLEESGLREDDRDGVVVHSSTTATFRIDSVDHNLVLGEEINILWFKAKVEKISFISINNIENYIILNITEARDACHRERLMEFTCDPENRIDEITFDCPNGCEEGKCIGQENEPCEVMLCPGECEYGCEIADDGCLTNTCKTNQTFCPSTYKPVCGYNGETYTNDCFAKHFTMIDCEGTCPCEEYERDYDLGHFPEMFIGKNWQIVVGNEASSSTIIGASEILSSIQEVTRDQYSSDTVVFEKDVINFDQSFILIGTPANNNFINDFPKLPDMKPGEGYLILTKNGNNWILIVTGVDDESVRKAARAISNVKEFNLKCDMAVVMGDLENLTVACYVEEEPVVIEPIEPAYIIEDIEIEVNFYNLYLPSTDNEISETFNLYSDYLSNNFYLRKDQEFNTYIDGKEHEFVLKSVEKDPWICNVSIDGKVYSLKLNDQINDPGFRVEVTDAYYRDEGAVQECVLKITKDDVELAGYLDMEFKGLSENKQLYNVETFRDASIYRNKYISVTNESNYNLEIKDEVMEVSYIEAVVHESCKINISGEVYDFNFDTVVKINDAELVLDYVSIWQYYDSNNQPYNVSACIFRVQDPSLIISLEDNDMVRMNTPIELIAEFSEDEISITEEHIEVMVKAKLDEAAAKFTFRLMEMDEQQYFPIYYGEKDIGRMQVNMNIREQGPRPVTYYVDGTVHYTDSKPYNGEISIEVNDVFYKGTVENGEFDEIKINGFEGDTAIVTVNGQVVEKFILEDDQIYTSFEIIVEGSDDNFEDADQDGVPDDKDECPDSTGAVDWRGCDCNQKKCGEDSTCIVTDRGEAVCLYHCNDKIQNYGEEGVDCGGSCSQKCDFRVNCYGYDSSTGRNAAIYNKCLENKPEYCNSAATIEQNCQQCGCPDDWTCKDDGKCYTTIETTGLKCLVNEYDYGYNMDCGDDYKTFNVGNWIDVKASGFPITKKIAEKNARKELDNTNVCVLEEDYGCVAKDTICPGDALRETMYNNPVFADAKYTFQQYINEEVKKEADISTGKKAGIMGAGFAIGKLISGSVLGGGIPGLLIGIWAGRVNIDIEVKDIENAPMSTQYECDPVEISSDQRCKALITNGNQHDKADILFIGDGYFYDSELIGDIENFIDYEGIRGSTNNEGLFSIEPFKSHKERFNIWYTVVGNEISHNKRDDISSFGWVPSVTDVHHIAMKCQGYDYVVVLSKYSYRSHATFDGFSYCSIMDSYPGRLVTHEFGHSFGKLADEYYNFKTANDVNGIVEDILFGGSTGPNCRKTMASAQTGWGDIAASDQNVNYFKGCGGDCSEECANWVRPTELSVMNNHRLKEGTSPDDKTTGPPFAPWYAVNERELLKELNKYK